MCYLIVSDGFGSVVAVSFLVAVSEALVAGVCRGLRVRRYM